MTCLARPQTMNCAGYACQNGKGRYPTLAQRRPFIRPEPMGPKERGPEGSTSRRISAHNVPRHLTRDSPSAFAAGDVSVCAAPQLGTTAPREKRV